MTEHKYFHGTRATLPAMKKEMSAFDIMAVVMEMQPLVGGYLDKVFHWDRKNVLLRVNIPGTGRREVLLIDLNWLYVSNERPETPDTPSQFAVHLRKLLSNGRLVSIKQQEFDRVVLIEVQKEQTYQIVIELFGEGNLILVSEGKIVNCLVYKKWKHREVRPGADYSFPPPRFNPKQAGLEDFKRSFRASNSDVVRTLATAINLGGQYAEEVSIRSGIDKNRKAASLSEEEVERLQVEMNALIAAIERGSNGCTVLQEDGSFIDVAPVELKQYVGKGTAYYPSYSEAVQAYLDQRKEKAQDVQESPELQRLLRQVSQLKEAIERGKAEMEMQVQKAEFLYAHYQEAQAFLANFETATKEMDWEEVKAYAKNNQRVQSVDPQKSVVTLGIGDLKLDLAYDKGVDENANIYYSRAKEAKEKLAKSQEVLLETEAKVTSLRQRHEKERKAAKSEVKKTKVFWFEAYKWFFSSGGHLVLAGRDARTNDQVVKKHLTSVDRYAHADVHGAPSTIVKEGATATEEELEEACAFALTHSKAWNAGIPEGSAYWVLPDQVSKTPEAGEFVPRGAFIIRGKRNYAHHIPMELAMGEIEHLGARKVMCGPRSAVLPRSTRYVIIVPGDAKGSRASASLAREFLVPEEEISRILPPGNVEIKERHGMDKVEGEG
jgi:predicted ribosome quality control (RQC) complex YloA/Tae2 family protein